MIIQSLFPLAFGALGVLQNAINKKFAESLGIPLALVINNFVLLACGFIFYAVVKAMPQESLPELLKQKSDFQFQWKLLIPGIFGYLIIAGMPYSIDKIGATKVVIGVVVAQVITSIIWDYYVESMPISFTRVTGAALALIGVLLAAK